MNCKPEPILLQWPGTRLLIHKSSITEVHFLQRALQGRGHRSSALRIPGAGQEDHLGRSKAASPIACRCAVDLNHVPESHLVLTGQASLPRGHLHVLWPACRISQLQQFHDPHWPQCPRARSVPASEEEDVIQEARSKPCRHHPTGLVGMRVDPRAVFIWASRSSEPSEHHGQSPVR